MGTGITEFRLLTHALTRSLTKSAERFPVSGKQCDLNVRARDNVPWTAR